MMENQNAPQSERQLRRNLSNRHIQLIAIGGAIGTGLFMGSGKTISLAGPSIIFVYMIIGFMLFFVMRALGELLLSNLNYKSFIDFSEDLLGPWAGFFMGWTYWFCWIVTGMSDVVAISARYVPLFLPACPHWLSSLLLILLFVGLNLVAVRAFGETEFWFAILKVVLIVGLIFVGLYMVVTGFKSPSGSVASYANLWRDGGMFPHGMMGFLAGFQIAVFAYVGIELVGTTAAETANPVKVLPRAINAIPIRVIAFYVLSLITIMAITPWSSVVADQSPFVELFLLAGIPSAALVVNFVVLTSAASSANSGIFSTSRMIYGLATEGDAPKVFSVLSKRSVPARALLFSCICLLGGVGLNYLVPNIVTAFTIITTLSAVLFIFVWSVILISYLTYRKKRPELHEKSVYKMPGGRLMCWIVLAFFVCIIGVLCLESDTRQALMGAPLWFILLGAVYFFLRKGKKQGTRA